MLAFCPLLLHRDVVLSAILNNADSFRDTLFAFRCLSEHRRS